MAHAVIAKNSLNEELFMMERNPYYFGVDPETNSRTSIRSRIACSRPSMFSTFGS